MNSRHSTAPSPGERAREFAFTPEDFEELRALVRRVTGISLSDGKRELVYSRLSRRLRALGLTSFGDYRQLLSADDSQEMVEFCNALTTNLTSFFREAHHFEFLREQLLAPRRADPHASRRLRIWSSACSTGEEPYSIAMTVCEAIPEWRKWDIRILATDVDSAVLERARAGVYPADRVSGLGARRLATHFTEEPKAPHALYRISADVASLITYKALNLMHAFPMRGPLDAIFCRNVVIYFDKETQRELFARMACLQRAGDLLFLGHSESLFKVSDAYTLVGKTVYRRR